MGFESFWASNPELFTGNLILNWSILATRQHSAEQGREAWEMVEQSRDNNVRLPGLAGQGWALRVFGPPIRSCLLVTRFETDPF